MADRTTGIDLSAQVKARLKLGETGFTGKGKIAQTVRGAEVEVFDAAGAIAQPSSRIG